MAEIDGSPTGNKNTALVALAAMAVNRAQNTRDLSHLDPSGDTKHIKAYTDYGWPVNPKFEDFYNQYDRNPMAYAGVTRIVDRIWEENPWVLQGSEEIHDETTWERLFREFAERVDLWRVMKQADEYSRVGEYAGIIIRIRDGKQFSQPVEGRVDGGLDSILELIPAFQGQLKLSDWVSDQSSEDYGKPTMYQYREASLPRKSQDDNAGYEHRSFDVHPDRVWIWSQDGKPHGRSPIKSVLNNLINLQKISGAGGEGFWKNCRQNPLFDIDPAANLATLAQALGVDDVDEIKDALGEEVSDWNSGLDNLIMTQGMKPEFPSVQLPQPQEFIEAEMNQIAAGFKTPSRILIGNQQGERSSTEDEKGFNKSAASRAEGYCTPNIRRILTWLIDHGMVEDSQDWFISWPDFTAPTGEQRQERGKSMSTINKDHLAIGGEPVFSVDEIRESMGYGPADDVDSLDPDEDEEEPQANKQKRIVVNVWRARDGG